MDKYTVVLDYASLYPSSMISENLSHDSICLDEQYLGDEGAAYLKELGELKIKYQELKSLCIDEIS